MAYQTLRSINCPLVSAALHLRLLVRRPGSPLPLCPFPSRVGLHRRTAPALPWPSSRCNGRTIRVRPEHSHLLSAREAGHEPAPHERSLWFP